MLMQVVVGVLVAAQLAGAMWLAKVDGHAGVDRELSAPTWLLALV